MKLTLDNRDTEMIHIDTYSMLTGESAEEQERENMKDQGRDDWDTVDIEYNHDAIVKDFAMASIEYLQHELSTEKPKIVESITYVSHGSPKFYNYTTDHYVAVYDVDEDELQKYIALNYDAVIEKARAYDSFYVSGEVSKEDLAHAGLCHYIDNTINGEYYNGELWECEGQIYYQNSTMPDIIESNY